MDTSSEERAIREAAPAYIETVPDAAPAYECPPAYEERAIRDRIQQTSAEREELLIQLVATGFDPELFEMQRHKLRELDEEVRQLRARVQQTKRETEAERKSQDRASSSLKALANRLRRKSEYSRRADSLKSESSHERSYSDNVVRGFEALHELHQLESIQREALDAHMRLQAAAEEHERVLAQLDPLYGRIFECGLRSKPRKVLAALKSDLETAELRTKLAEHRDRIEESVLRDLRRTFVLLRRTIPVFSELLVGSQAQGWAMGNTFANMDSQMEEALINAAAVSKMIVEVREQQDQILVKTVDIDTDGTKPRAVIRRCSWDGAFYRRMDEARRRMVITQKGLVEEIERAKQRKSEAEQACITNATKVSLAKLELLWRRERLIEHLMRGENE